MVEEVVDSIINVEVIETAIVDCLVNHHQPVIDVVLLVCIWVMHSANI